MLLKFLKSEVFFSISAQFSLKSGLCPSVFGRGGRLLSQTAAGNHAHEAPRRGTSSILRPCEHARCFIFHLGCSTKHATPPRSALAYALFHCCSS